MAKGKLTGTLTRSDLWLKSSYERLAVSRLILEADKKLLDKTRELIELSKRNIKVIWNSFQRMTVSAKDSSN